MSVRYFQDYYPDNYSHCYGCGRLNLKGMHNGKEITDGKIILKATVSAAESITAKGGAVMVMIPDSISGK